MDEFNKCRYCQYYDEYDGCVNGYCWERDEYVPNRYKIIKKAKQLEISVYDLLDLIELGG